jgi:carboxyl-terminal processing protease
MRLVLFVFPFCFIVQAISAQQPKNFSTEARMLKKTILENHVQPVSVDNKYSRWVFDQFINNIDPDRLFFTQEDIRSVETLRDKIDDDLNTASWVVLPQLTTMIKKSLERYQKGITELGQQPIDFTKADVFDPDTSWSANEAALKKRLAQEFRISVFERLVDQQRKTAARNEAEFLKQYEKPARELVQRVMSREAGRMLQSRNGFDVFVAQEFFKMMSAAFDPHTTYFSAEEVQDFMARLSTSDYFFGISVGENEKGELIITQLMPGGPAWKSGEIHTGDVLQMIRWQGGDPIELWGADISEVNDIMDENNHLSMEFTLKRPDGTYKTVVLRKEKVESEESVVKSFLLDGAKRIGYIALPDFYTDWGNKENSRCATDVAREIINLKKEKIEGLIIDLRFNGGGSLTEASAMAGIFIDVGPVAVLKDKAGTMVTIKDSNRGIIYEGPLVLMINGMSASASEILSAALQDHNRAVIVGGRTYGKSTAQRIIPTETRAATRPATDKLAAGFTKVTIEKVYRITGKTAQLNGVTPDISLPDVFKGLGINEASMPRALPSDSINKKMYYTPLPALPLKELAEKSRARVSSNPKFASIERYSEHLAAGKEQEKPFGMSWKNFNSLYQDLKSEVSVFEASSTTEQEAFKASKLDATLQRMQIDSYANEVNQAYIKNLQKDIFLNEAFHIICDLVSYVTKK